MMTLSDFINKNGGSFCFDSKKTLLLVEDCPYAICVTNNIIREFLDRYVLGFDTECSDNGDIVITWIKLSAEC